MHRWLFSVSSCHASSPMIVLRIKNCDAEDSGGRSVWSVWVELFKVLLNSRRTRPAAPQRQADLTSSIATTFAASQERVDSFEVGRRYEASPGGRGVGLHQPRHHYSSEDSLQADVVQPWCRKTRRAYSDCALSLMTRRMWSDAYNWLLRVTPRILSVNSQATPGSSGSDWTLWRRRLS